MAVNAPQTQYALFIQTSDYEIWEEWLYFYDPLQRQLLPKDEAWKDNKYCFPCWLLATPDRKLLYGVGYNENSEEGYLLFLRWTGEVVSKISIGCDVEYDEWSEFENWSNGCLTILGSDEKVYRVLMDGTPIASAEEEYEEPFSNSEENAQATGTTVQPISLPPLDKYGRIVEMRTTAYGDGFFVQAITAKGVCHTLIVHQGKIYELGTEYKPGKLIQKGNRSFVKIDNDLFALEPLEARDSGYRLRHIIELTNYRQPMWQYFDDPFSPDGRYLTLGESHSSPDSRNSFVDVVDLETGERWRAFESQMHTGVQWIVIHV
ncbi:MAG: hypothetical protein QNJ51_30510 [Calothrix sp. MO_167.B12]|nr:hypothetical protein [Calothrix sp. MO_167.B12]